MSKSEENLLQKIVDYLQWHKSDEMPNGKEKIVCIFEDGTMGGHYAINCALYWKKIERWVYVSEIEEIANRV